MQHCHWCSEVQTEEQPTDRLHSMKVRPTVLIPRNTADGVVCALLDCVKHRSRTCSAHSEFCGLPMEKGVGYAYQHTGAETW